MRKLPAAAQEERRRQVIGLRQRGLTYGAITEQVGLSRTGVFDICRRFAAEGAKGLASKPRGRMGWQKASGYSWRALAESDVSRWKRVIGDGLRSQTDGRQATEVAIAAEVLNRMLDLGRPEYVRIA